MSDWQKIRNRAKQHKSGADGAAIPPNGEHTVYLERAVVRDTFKGERLVTEWKSTGTPGAAFYSWSTWFAFEPEADAFDFTLAFLEELGIDPETLDADYVFEREIGARIGLLYEVKTRTWGDNNDQVNVSVLGEAQARQAQLADVPIEPVTVPRAEPVDDDDIPF